MKRKGMIAALATLCGITVVSLTMATVCWFGGNTKIASDKLKGSVLQNYFYSGDGSESDPFTIATRKHYENFIRLQDEMPGYAEAGFYFEFGAELDKNEDNGKEFFAYNDEGKLQNGYSKTLNCKGMVLPPMGSEENPFVAHLNGNNLTISGFEIDGTGQEDIGVFGFVGSEAEVDETGASATIYDAYFENYTIHTKGGKKLSDSHASINGESHPTNIHMGYLAGHIITASSFNNVYVNNCTLDGAKPASGQHTQDEGLDNYGYFGKVEIDNLGGETGKGHNYEFTLNSQACYNYFNDNYDDIKNENLTLRRNDAEDDRYLGTTDIEVSEGQQLNSAIGTRTLVGDVLRRYEIKNKSESEYYSLSSTGYTSNQKFTYEENNFNVYYDSTKTFSTLVAMVDYAESPEAFIGQHAYCEQDDTTYYISAPGELEILCSGRSTDVQKTIPDTEPVNSGRSLKDDKDGLVFEIDPETGLAVGDGHPTHYYYKNSSNQWMYGVSYNKTFDPDVDIYNLTFNIEIPSFRTDLIYGAPTVTIRTANLYFDDQTIDFKNKVTTRPSSTSGLSRKTIYFTVEPIRIDSVGCGYHNIAFELDIRYTGIFSHTTHLYDGTLTRVGNTNNYTLTQYEIMINTTKQVDIASSNMHEVGSSQTISGHTTKSPRPLEEGSAIIDDRSAEYPMYFYRVEDGVEESDYVEPSVINGTYQLVGTDFTYNSPTSWTAYKARRIVDENAEIDNYYIADSAPMVSSGYNNENIDVVGGPNNNATQFYYHDFKLGSRTLFSTAVISLPSETQAGQLVKTPTAKGGTKQFYATEYCPNTVVLYILNAANALDNKDDQLGTIEFTYVQFNILGFNLNLVTPTFKKGDGFLDLDSAGDTLPGETSTTSNPNMFTQKVSIGLKESKIQKASYCCLDKEGKILGRYNSSGVWQGNPGDEAKIYTYVMCIGGQSNNGYSAWVTNVDFSYKANEGYGGTFGRVGYRSRTETVPMTRLNIYFKCPADTDYSLKVAYTSNNRRYTITFTSSDTDLEITVYLYQPDSGDDDYVSATSYGLYVNGSAAGSSGGTFNAVASS